MTWIEVQSDILSSVELKDLIMASEAGGSLNSDLMNYMDERLAHAQQEVRELKKAIRADESVLLGKKTALSVRSSTKRLCRHTLTELRKHHVRLRDRKMNLSQQISKLRKELQEVEQELVGIPDELRALRAESKALTKETEELHAAVSTITQKCTEMKELVRIKEISAQAYQSVIDKISGSTGMSAVLFYSDCT